MTPSQASRILRARRRAAKLCGRCNGPAPTTATCARCLKQQAERRYCTSLEYEPIDEQLDRMRYRILRALRFHDWICTESLLDQIGLSRGDDGTHKERNAASRMFLKLFNAGLVKRQELAFCSRKKPEYEYGISDAGRAEIARLYRNDYVAAAETMDEESL